MKISVLASGSKGNVTYLEVNNKKFLLDCGKNYKYIKEKLEEIDVAPSEIDYILISHNHDDHISALKTFVSKNDVTILISQRMLMQIEEIKDYKHIKICEDVLELEGITINSFRSSHDAIDSRNFVIEFNDKKIAYITDTGYINNRYFRVLRNLDIYLFESNHDIELLQHGPYPSWLKKRVISDNGHLSNKLASFYLAKLIGDKTKKVILIHLSDTNNLEEIALETFHNTLIDYELEFKNVICARQNEATEMVEI